MKTHKKNHNQLNILLLQIFSWIIILSTTSFAQNTDIHSVANTLHGKEISNYADSLARINNPLALEYCIEEIRKINYQDQPILFFHLMTGVRNGYFGTIQVHKADSISNFLLSIVTENLHPIFHVEILKNKANIALLNKQNIEAVRLIQSALGLSEKENDIAAQIDAFLILSTVYQTMERYAISLEYAEKAIELSKITTVSTDDFLALLTKAKSLIQLNRMTEADKSLSQAKTLAFQLDNIDFQGKIFHMTGLFFYKQNNYIKALEYFDLALSSFEKLNNKTKQSSIITQKAAVAGKLEKYKLAADLNHKALEIRQDIQYQHLIASSYYNIASSLFYLQKYDSVLYYVKKGEVLYRSYHNNPDIVRGYNLRKKVAIAKGNYHQAYNILNTSMQIRDSIFHNRNKHKIVELESDFSRGKYMQIKTEMETETKLQQVKTERNNLFLQVSIFVLFLVILSSYLYFLYFKSKNNHKIILTSQKLIFIQMNSHFVFNALTAIQSLIYKQDIKTANHYLSIFSNMMNRIIDVLHQNLVSLQFEIDFVKEFLEIQHLRFGDDLQYEIDIDKNLNLSRIKIPPMLIYPFIEYAVEECVQNANKNTDDKPMLLIKLKDQGKYLIYEVIDKDLGFSDLNNCFIKRYEDKEINCEQLTLERMATYKRFFKTKFTFAKSKTTIDNKEYYSIVFKIKK